MASIMQIGIPSILLLIIVLCEQAVAMRNEMRFLQKPWMSASNDAEAHDPELSGENIYNPAITNRRVRSLNASGMSYPQNVSYSYQYINQPETSRDPDRVLFSVVIHGSDGSKYHVGLPSRKYLWAFKWAKPSYSFVLDDHVYYVPNPEESPIRVSADEEGKLHGTFDWVYNEEIFGKEKIRGGAMWFSKSHKYLAYASRSANSSKEMMMTTYSRGETYDYNYNMEYPKTGEERLAVVSVSIWSVEERKSKTMEVQLSDSKVFHYLFGVSWVVLHGKELLLTTWANRWQNETSITLCSYEEGTCSLIYEHKYEHGQWASPEDYADIIHSNSSFFVILPQTMGDNAWQHITKIDINIDFKFDSISFLPASKYDIRDIVAYRPQEDLIIYRAKAPLPWNRHAYATPAGETSALSTDKCVTCIYSNCTYQGRPTVSRGDSLDIAFECKGPSPPYHASVSLDATLHSNEIKIIPNEAAVKDFTNILSPPSTKTQYEWTIETFLLMNGFEANVKIYFGESKDKSVPVSLVVYGGPDMNQVTDKHETYPMPIGYKYAIVYIDVRGSGGRGWKYRSEVYGRLVTMEVQDTVEAMKLVLAKYPRLDKNKVGVFGWSYGGTMAARLVEVAPTGFFKCAVAGAPVTNFLYYDATYTERFMGDAYNSSYVDLTLDVSKFMHTDLLLVHGLRDDNVHFQNSALLIEALQQADIKFQLMVYPNEGHSIERYSNHFNNHLLTLFNSFFDTCYA